MEKVNCAAKKPGQRKHPVNEKTKSDKVTRHHLARRQIKALEALDLFGSQSQ